MYIYNYTTATADSFYLQQFLCRHSSFFFFSSPVLVIFPLVLPFLCQMVLWKPFHNHYGFLGGVSTPTETHTHSNQQTLQIYKIYKLAHKGRSAWV